MPDRTDEIRCRCRADNVRAIVNFKPQRSGPELK